MNQLPSSKQFSEIQINGKLAPDEVTHRWDSETGLCPWPKKVTCKICEKLQAGEEVINPETNKKYKLLL